MPASAADEHASCLNVRGALGLVQVAMQLMALIEQKFGDGAEFEALLIVAAIATGEATTVQFVGADGLSEPFATGKAKGLIHTVDKAR